MTDPEHSNTIKALAHGAQMRTEESPLKTKESKHSLVIGVPAEQSKDEKRIGLTPGSVGVLVSNGNKVLLESGAGLPSGYSDRAYSDKGAEICYEQESVYKAEIVLKLNPPTFEELELMSPKSTLISALQRSQMKKEYLVSLNKKKITAVGYELLEDKGGLKPIVRSLSEVASNCIITVASDLLTNRNGGSGILFGGVTGVPPTKVVILGAGTIGGNVCRITRQMGAEVRVFDKDHYKLRRLKKDLGEQVYTSMIDNYTLEDELKNADVVVGCLRSEEGHSMCVVTEDMVMNMKPGSVIIDASISQGGCFETSEVTTHDNPTFVKHDVIHYCVPNITSMVAQTTTRALSYLFTPMLLQVSRVGGVEEMMNQKKWFMKGVYSYRGCLTNLNMSKYYNLPYKALDLFLAVQW